MGFWKVGPRAGRPGALCASSASGTWSLFFRARPAKNSSFPLRTLAALALLGLAYESVHADGLVVEAETATLTDPEALTHEVIVHYESVHGVDVSSLGDDDIIVGRHSLFGPGLGSSAPLARLSHVDAQDQETHHAR